MPSKILLVVYYPAIGVAIQQHFLERGLEQVLEQVSERVLE